VKACVFLGPTLPPEEAAAALDAVYLPPVQQGDLYRAAVRHRPRAIGIVDGYFQHVPSVWHKEILWAMAEGIHVFGAASMGALRAAELAAFGMRGVGRIFEAYRTGRFEPYADEVFEDEDEVAIVHRPDAGYLALSEAMVNIRSTLAAAAGAGIISAATRDGLVRIAKQLFYPERSWERILGPEARGAPEREVEALRRWLPVGRVDQKRDDAQAMLAAMRDWLAADPPPARVGFVFQRSEMWQRAVAAIAAADEQDGGEAVEREALFDELRLAGTYAEARRAGVLRWAGLRECQRQGLVEGPEDRRAAEAALRNRFGLSRRRDIDQWLAENGLDDGNRAQLLADEARLRRLDRALGPLATAHVVSHLRATGQYPQLAARARAKSRVLGRTDGDSRVDGPTRLRLALWYFEHRLGRQVPDDLDEYTASHGFADTDALFRALWREYRYLAARPAAEPGATGVAANAPTEG
jgi:hypothetical protein